MEDVENLIVKWDGPVRVVGPAELGPLTESGWRLLAAYPEDELETSFDQDVNPVPRKPDDYSYCPTVSTQRGHTVRKMTYLVGLDADRHREDQAAAITDLTERLKEATDATDAAAKARDAVVEDRDRLKRVSERSEERVRELLQEVRDEQARRRRIETDMAKVRQAVGDLRWREITSEDGK